MRCPFCGFLEDRVIDSRATQAGEAIRRRRECLECLRRYTTYERVEESFPQIVKRDGSREDYARQKVVHGIRLACIKRPISTDALDEVVDHLEQTMLDLNVREVSSDWIGATVTEQLRGLDLIAYIRFASVYRGFDRVEEFLGELQACLPASPSRPRPPARKSRAAVSLLLDKTSTSLNSEIPSDAEVGDSGVSPEDVEGVQPSTHSEASSGESDTDEN